MSDFVGAGNALSDAVTTDFVGAGNALSDAVTTERDFIGRAASALERLYASRSAASPLLISDNIGMGLGNQVKLAVANVLLAVASRRRLVVLSPMVNAMFDVPDGVLADVLQKGVNRPNVVHLAAGSTSRVWAVLQSNATQEVCLHWNHMPREAMSVVAQLLVEQGGLPAPVASDQYFQLSAAAAFLLRRMKAAMRQNLELFERAVYPACDRARAPGVGLRHDPALVKHPVHCIYLTIHLFIYLYLYILI